jgi:hypothetical protein
VENLKDDLKTDLDADWRMQLKHNLKSMGMIELDLSGSR